MFASFSVKVSTIYLILMMLIIFTLLATDYWVKRFGFMWGGGNSGMSGLKALQVSQKLRLNCVLWTVLF